MLTSVLPDGGQRFSYTTIGRRLFFGNEPLYIHDSVRSRPSLVVGSTGYGKTELLLSVAWQDIMKGRLTIFVDGKCDEITRDKLYYYTCVAGKKKGKHRKFLSFLPYVDAGHITHTWNPFISKYLNIHKTTELFMNAYAEPTKAPKGDGDYYIEVQRDVLSSLMRALDSSGYAYNVQDIRYLLENQEILRRLASIVRNSGIQHYGNLMSKITREGGKEFTRTLTKLLNYLANFDFWAMNSYNPSIVFDDLLGTDAVVYVGLPVNAEPYTMGKIGNIIVNQLKAISSHIQTNEKMERRTISCIIDEAGSFVDTGLAEWICKVRSSGFMLMLGIQNLANLEGRRPGFAEEIRANTPNVMMFNPQDVDTAEWFSKIAGMELKVIASATVKEGKEGDGGTAKTQEVRKIPVDALVSLRTGQFYYKGPIPMERPTLLAAPFLPPSPNRPDSKFKRSDYDEKPVRKGLHVGLQVLSARKVAGESQA